MNPVFVYSDEFATFDYGASHPLKPFRLKLTRDLIQACGLLEPADPRLIIPAPATEGELLAFHTPDYIQALKTADSGQYFPAALAYGLGPGDNPVFPGVFQWSCLVAGASLQAADLVDRGTAGIAFSIAGGLHHALAGRASGFCYINDAVLAIQSLVKKGRRVAYIDIDAHHGDGVQKAFYGTDQVLTISLHETGATLFPGTGFEGETGVGRGTGYSVNIPLPPESDDELFLLAFSETVPPLIESFRPDIIVSQLGVDTFRDDPLAHLNYTTIGFCAAVARIKDLGKKWIALGGGGYNQVNVARAWTLAWAIMNGVDVEDEIPGAFLERYRQFGFPQRLRDTSFVMNGGRKEQMRKEVMRVIRQIKKQL